MEDNLPTAKGSYALLFHLSQPAQLKIGRLGKFAFSPGNYLYLGSAGGSGGLRARLRHHLRIAERPHWHLDWLRPHLEARAVFYTLAGENGAPLECVWAAEASSRAAASVRPGAGVPAPGFGASDCRQGCAAHFFRLPDGFEIADVRQLLQDSGNCQVFVIIPSDRAVSC